MNEEDCRNCWAVRFCSLCFASLAGKGILQPTLKQEGCPGIRMRVEDAFKTYASVWERNPEAWKYMDDIVIK